jgi:hypothetical protein
MGRYDRHSKWIIGQHGDSILRLGGLSDEIVKWYAAQAEIVEPTKLPDGLLEVLFTGRKGTDTFIIEIVTYADKRVFRQVQEDVALVYAQRKIIPEVLVVVLRPKGSVDIVGSHVLTSRLGWTRWETNCRVVQLWHVPEETIWSLRDPGLVRWIPLCKSDRSPEAVVDQCRETIERDALVSEQLNLLVVTQVFTWLRYQDNSLLQRLGGRKMITDSDLIQEVVEELVEERVSKVVEERVSKVVEERVSKVELEKGIRENSEAILAVLESRFDSLPEELLRRLRQVRDEAELKRLIRWAARCPDMVSFLCDLPE